MKNILQQIQQKKHLSYSSPNIIKGNKIGEKL